VWYEQEPSRLPVTEEHLPSVTHQVLASMFRESPALALRLLQSATGTSLPAGAQARLHAAQFTDLRPPEYAADAACLIEDEAGKALGALITEIQLSPDELKPPSWLSYTATLHRALLVPVTVLAVTVTEEMERWCARPYPYDHLGSTFRPLVIGPSAIPRITDVEQARALPELALLSVAAHGHEPGAEAIGIAAYLAAGALDTDRGARYADIVMAWLSDAARRALEEHMSLHGYRPQSEFFRKHFDEGRKEGLEDGLKEGLVRAIEGITEVLGISLSAEQRATLAKADVERLEAIYEALLSSKQWPAD
jgi:hypothetical protein